MRVKNNLLKVGFGFVISVISFSALASSEVAVNLLSNDKTPVLDNSGSKDSFKNNAFSEVNKVNVDANLNLTNQQKKKLVSFIVKYQKKNDFINKQYTKNMKKQADIFESSVDSVLKEDQKKSLLSYKSKIDNSQKEAQIRANKILEKIKENQVKKLDLEIKDFKQK